MPRVISVSALNKYLKTVFDMDGELRQVYIEGELSNFKVHSNGNYYFTLKDDFSKVNGIMYHNYTKNIDEKFKDGDKVMLVCSVSVYEKGGYYTLVTYVMKHVGVGDLYQRFELLKKQLEADGLFAIEHKKALPKLPKRIGIITASTGAAIHDILTTIENRYLLAEIIIFPSLVQGVGAVDDLVKNLDLAAGANLDVIIIGRGGGSIEDLWAFNEVRVAKAIYDCEIPIISAVGHETDFTISDFVADVRAATPTAAAVLATPNQKDLIELIKKQNMRSKELIENKLNKYLTTFNYLNQRYNYFDLNKKYEQKFEKIKQNYLTIQKSVFSLIEKRELSLNTLSTISNQKITNLVREKEVFLEKLNLKLTLNSPLTIMEKGYSLVYDNNNLIKSINQIETNQSLIIQFSDGKALVKVERILEENNGK